MADHFRLPPRASGRLFIGCDHWEVLSRVWPMEGLDWQHSLDYRKSNGMSEKRLFHLGLRLTLQAAQTSLPILLGAALVIKTRDSQLCLGSWRIR